MYVIYAVSFLAFEPACLSNGHMVEGTSKFQSWKDSFSKLNGLSQLIWGP